MRVGILLPPMNRPLSGIGHYTVELVRALAALPDAPTITLIATDGPGGLADLALETRRLQLCRRFPALIAWGGAQLSRLVRRARLDVLHDMSGAVPFEFVPRRVKCVATVYDTIPYSLPGYSNWVDRLNYLYRLPRTLKRADAVLTISASSRRDIAQYLKVPIARVHHVGGGKSDRYRPLDAATVEAARSTYHLPRNYLLFVGAMVARKNLARVLEALARVRRQHADARLVLVGARNWQADRITALVQALGLADHVVLTGYVPEHHLPLIYNGARAFVFPSLYEGFGLPVIEALACGVPVITSTVSSLPEVAGDAALLVDPYDVEQIAAAMVQTLTDEKLRHTLRARGLARAAQFTWAEVARKTGQIYQQLMDADS